LFDDGEQAADAASLIEQFCRDVAEAGVPLARMTCAFATRHPQILGHQLMWRRDRPGVTTTPLPHGVERTATCVDSPIRVLHAGATRLRRRLTGPHARLDFPILRELAAEGATDYLAVPVRFTSGGQAYVSWVSKQPHGFSDPDVAVLLAALPALALRLEIHARIEEERDLLRVYLGKSAARRILRGEVLLGQGSRVHAVVWYSDLRGFTALADRLPAERVIAILNAHFDCVVTGIQRHGGEVLKFIGDGLLAAFNIDGTNSAAACCQALDAATDVLSTLEGHREDGEALRLGIALHVGEVLFGNIGATDRLDFTVIGRTVNEVTRIERLCRMLEEPLLVSARFARACRCRPLASLGRHVLAGVAEPQEIFVPAPMAVGSTRRGRWPAAAASPPSGGRMCGSGEGLRRGDGGLGGGLGPERPISSG
jgi:adenylate cyclase